MFIKKAIRYRSLLQILILILVLFSCNLLSQLYISDSATLFIEKKTKFTESESIKESVKIYVVNETKVTNIGVLSNSEILHTEKEEENEFKNTKQLLTSNKKTKHSENTDKKILQPKEYGLKSEFKNRDDQTLFLSLNSFFGSYFTATQYHNAIFINDFADNNIFQFFNNKRKNVYAEEEINDVGISNVFRIRPPPFYA